MHRDPPGSRGIAHNRTAPAPGAEGYTRAMPIALLRPALCCMLAVACCAVSAQWAWRDAAGNRVYSDQPPPASVPDRDILRQPGGSRPAAAATEPASAAEGSRPVASAPQAGASAADREQDAQRKRAEAAEAARAKAQEERLAKARAENCLRGRQAKATFDSGIRVARTNAQGEREILDDATRTAEAKRLNEIIASDCK